MQTVLLVEDSKFLRIANERILAKAQYAVICVTDGEEALRIAQESHPDIILLDMMLPKLSGPEVLDRLKRDPRTVSIPVIILTSLSDKNEQKLKKAGAVAFLCKDHLLQDSGALLLAVKQALELIATVP